MDKDSKERVIQKMKGILSEIVWSYSIMDEGITIGNMVVLITETTGVKTTVKNGAMEPGERNDKIVMRRM